MWEVVILFITIKNIIKLEATVNLLQYDLQLKQKSSRGILEIDLFFLDFCYYTLKSKCINEKKMFFINHIIPNSSSNNTLSNIKSQRIMNNWYAFHLHDIAVSFNVSIKRWSHFTNPSVNNSQGMNFTSCFTFQWL